MAAEYIKPVVQILCTKHLRPEEEGTHCNVYFVHCILIHCIFLDMQVKSEKWKAIWVILGAG